MILANEWDKDLVPKEISVEAAAQKLVRTVTAACDATMPRQCPRRKTGHVYWWTEKIAPLKSKANQLRRQYQRIRGREAAQQKVAEYQQARRNLKAAIRESKQSRWMELCSQVEGEPSEQPYKILMKKVNVTKQMEPKAVERIVDQLFLQLPTLKVTP